MTLGWAIITTGLHADVKTAPALHATPDAELVAVGLDHRVGHLWPLSMTAESSSASFLRC